MPVRVHVRLYCRHEPFRSWNGYWITGINPVTTAVPEFSLGQSPAPDPGPE